MAYQITKHKVSIILVLLLLFSNCAKDRDISGFFVSTDPVNTRFEQSEIWNKSHPFNNFDVETENYTILVGGDSHIGGVRNFTALVAEAKKTANLALVIVGDLVTGKKEDYDVLKKYLPDFDEVPYFFMVGNHDLFYDGWKTFYDYFGSSTYYFTVKTPMANDIFICLDSGGGTLGDKQLTWLIDILSSKRENYRNCIVFTHLNFFRNRNQLSTNPLVTELYVLLDLFTKYRVDMVVSGHDHVKAVNVLGNTSYITLRALKDGISNPSFLKLNVMSDKVSCNFQGIK